MTTIADRVRQFLLEEVDFTGSVDELVADYPLLDAGVLDSLGIMALVEYLESEFEILIDEDDVVPENFESIGSIAAMVDAKSPA